MSATAIASVRGRRVWDSRGRPTVEAEVALGGGAVGRAIAPAGASTGSGEAVDLRDGGEAFGGYDVTRAVAAVNEAIAPALRGHGRGGPGGAGRAADRAGRHGEQVAPRRQRDARRFHGRRARGRGGGGPAALPPPRRRGRHAAAAAADPDLRRRRACRPARGRAGLPGHLPRGVELRRGAGLDRRGLPRRRRADEGSRHAWRAWPTRAAGGPPSRPTSRRWRRWCAPSSGRASPRAGRWRSRSTSRPPSSAAAAATGWGWKAASSTPAAWSRCWRAGSAPTRSSPWRTRWRRTTPRASSPSPARWATACRWWATISW